MSTFTRFFPFLKPYLSRMLLAGLLVMGVAVYRITEEFDHMDTDQLDALRG